MLLPAEVTSRLHAPEAYQISPECSVRFYYFFFLMQVAFYKFVVQTVILGFLYRTPQFAEALCSYPRFSFGPKLSFFVLGNFYMVY